jgi:hypothetical protein
MRAAQAPSHQPAPAMHRTPPGWVAAAPARAVLLVLALAACTTTPDVSAPPSPTQADRPPAAPTRTANNDARGAGSQPDYAGEAVLLRDQIAPRMPNPAPTDRRAACTAMLDAAAAFYGDIEPEADPRARLLADLQSTRLADLAQCERETSVRAATCVQLRLADRDAELPWLLDQCTRAFPD